VLNRSAIILSDLHLGPTCPKDTDQVAAEVIRRHPGHDVLLLGDTFDLSLDPPKSNPARRAAAHLARNPALRLSLRERLQCGASVVLFAGNHDAQLAQPGVRASLLHELDLTDDAPLQCGMWCMRRGALHLEHGHLYDPDNSNTHPLVAPKMTTEPLGVTLMRKVLAPQDSLFLAHAHEITPWAGLRLAFQRRGAGAPQLIARYYLEALRILLRARPRSFADEWRSGAEQLLEYARRYDLDVVQLKSVLDLRTTPRHHHRRDVFFRLYLDRSLATVLWWSGTALGAWTMGPAYWGLAGLGLTYLGVSLSLGKNRYSGNLLPRLRDAALEIRRLVDAQVVVFGHTHVEEQYPGYVNTGSFGFGGKQGRRYLLLDTTQSLFRMSVNPGHEPELLDVFVSGDDAQSTRAVVAA
jgi:predicted phosphodiesterase